MNTTPERIWLEPKSESGYDFESDIRYWKAHNCEMNDGDIEYHRSPQWVAVSERLPKTDDFVWVMTHGCAGYKAYYLNDAWYAEFPIELLGKAVHEISAQTRTHIANCVIPDVTHWMPLPTPPEDK